MNEVRFSTAFAALASLAACVAPPPPSHQVPAAPPSRRDVSSTDAAPRDSGGATKPSARPLVVRNTCDDSSPPVVPASSLDVVVGDDPNGAIAASLGLDTTAELPRSEGEALTLWLSRDHAGRPRKTVVAPSTNELDVGCRAVKSR